MFFCNTGLLPIKAHYFLFYAGTAPVVPYIPTLARQLGFSPVLVGALYTVLPVVGLVFKPLMGAVADRLHCQKVVLLVFLLLTIISLFPLVYIPGIPVEVSAELHCQQETTVKLCGVNGLASSDGNPNTTVLCQVHCLLNSSFLLSICNTWGWREICDMPTTPVTIPLLNSVTFDTLLLPWHTVNIEDTGCQFTKVGKVEISQRAQSHTPYCDSLQVAKCRMQCENTTLIDQQSSALDQYQFWMFATQLVLGYIGMAVVVSVGDAICFSILGEESSQFGQQRLWGSVGWGIFGVMAGWLVDVCSGGQITKNYTPIFYLMAVLLALNILAASRIQFTSVSHSSASLVNHLGQLLSDVQMIVFLLWLFIVGMCTALIWNWLFWYIEELADNAGKESSHDWIKTLEGLVNAIQSFGGELPFYFLSGWLLRMVGPQHAMSLVLFTFGVRFLLYSCVWDPWWVLPIELLHGPTSGLLWATAATYARAAAPPGTVTTAQGLVGAVFEGIGVSTGSLLAGVMFSHYSGVMVFRLAGLAVLVLCVLHICVQFFLSRKNTLIISDVKGYSGVHYRSPNDAVSMINTSNYKLLL